MEERWKNQSERLRKQAVRSRSNGTGQAGERQPATPDPNVFPTGEPSVFVRYPVLLLPLVLGFGAVVYELVTLWLSGW